MRRKNFGGAKIMLAVENPGIRQGLQNALQQTGFPRAVEITALDRMIATLTEARFDLILSTTELGAEFLPPFMLQLRQGALVHHPLPVIVQFLHSAEHDYVRKVIDSGPDDLLQMPVVPAQLLTRLGLLAEKPRNFIVTSDYVGPDRRKTPRPGAQAPLTIDVPNPLALRLAQKSDQAVLAEVTASADRLRLMRLARYIFELQWLLRAIRALFEQGSDDLARLISFCERIKILLNGLPRLMPDGLPEQVVPLVEKLETGSNILMKKGLSADKTILQGLSFMITSLARALRETLPPDLMEAAGPAPAAAS